MFCQKNEVHVTLDTVCPTTGVAKRTKYKWDWIHRVQVTGFAKRSKYKWDWIHCIQLQFLPKERCTSETGYTASNCRFCQKNEVQMRLDILGPTTNLSKEGSTSDTASKLQVLPKDRSTSETGYTASKLQVSPKERTYKWDWIHCIQVTAFAKRTKYKWDLIYCTQQQVLPKERSISETGYTGSSYRFCLKNEVQVRLRPS